MKIKLEQIFIKEFSGPENKDSFLLENQKGIFHENHKSSK